jgi:hypothetical protein
MVTSTEGLHHGGTRRAIRPAGAAEWWLHHFQKQERPPGEEEGAFPYSDSAKRE